MNEWIALKKTFNLVAFVLIFKVVVVDLEHTLLNSCLEHASRFLGTWEPSSNQNLMEKSKI